MDTYKLKFTQLQMEIFRLLCVKAGEQLNQRRVAKFLKVSPTAVAKALPPLEKEGLAKITRSRNMNLTLIELNRDNQTMLLKRAENLKLIYEVGLSKFLEDNFPGTTIILFGSYSRGEDTIKSDMDITIIGGKEKDIDLSDFEKRLEREISIEYYKSFKDMRKEFKENLCNGIVLAGGVSL